MSRLGYRAGVDTTFPTLQPAELEQLTLELVTPLSRWWSQLGQLEPGELAAILPVLARVIQPYGMTLDAEKVQASLAFDREHRARPR